MTEKVFILRFHHMGKFQNGQYVGGKETLIMNVDPDLFSFSVLMEHIKDDLKYTEVGGIYKRSDNEEEEWKLVVNDGDVVKDTKNADNMDFYIDNVIDTKCEPLQQMQPHVVIRPRPNVFEGINFFT